MADGLSLFATFLFTHNAGVSLLAFAVGFAFGLPSMVLMAYNGCIMGAFLALFAMHGLSVEFTGWLLIHGVTELLAVALAGAAGLHIGRAVAFPGQRTRLDAAAEAGRQAARVMVGVILMLFIAGILEGVGRQMIISTPVRYSIAAGTGLFWLVYLLWPRRGKIPSQWLEPQKSGEDAPLDDQRRFGRSLVTPEGVDLGVRIATAGERAGAFIIDALIMLAIMIAVLDHRRLCRGHGCRFRWSCGRSRSC